MHRVMLDTSSIVFAFSRKMDIFRCAEDQLQAHIVVSAGVIRELRGLAMGKTKEGLASKVALEIMKKYKVDVDPDDRSGDRWILDAGTAEDVYVCTNDIALKRELAERGKRALSVSENGS